MAKRATAIRRTWTADEARAVLDRWQASGESGASFAGSIGVVPQRLFWWRKRLERARAAGRGGVKKATTFAPVEVRPAALVALCAPVVVTTPAGVRIEVGEVDAATAAWVVAVLGGEGRS
jgi:transposase-like protein